MTKKNLLIAGSHGLIGTDLVKFFEETNQFNIELMDIALGINFTNLGELDKVFEELSKSGFAVEYIINSFGKNHHILNSEKKKKNLDGVVQDLEKLDNDVIFDYFNVNVMGVYNIIKSAIRFHSNSLKSVSTLGSIYSEKQPYHPFYDSPKSLGYVISKHALVGLNNYLSSYFGKHGIRFNIVSPGCIVADQSEVFKNNLISKTPIGRLSSAKDLFGILKLLASEDASYITGLNIKVDGGLALY